jgi:hypothetical protein
MAQTDDDDVLGEELPPTPRTPLLVVALCVLNVAAALAFAYLLIMDLDARHRWAAEVFRRDLAIRGLPLKEEEAPSEKDAIGAQAIAPRMTLEPAWLEKAYQDRTGKSLQEKFRPAELDPQRIRPQDLSEDLLKDLFSKYGMEPVATLDAEIDRLKRNVPKGIEAATEGAAKNAKNDQAKRDLLYAYLLPLAHLTDNVDQVVELDQAIKAANPKQLDGLIVDAARRKLLVDILLRLEEFRPHAPSAKDDKLLRAAALKPALGKAVGLNVDRYKVTTDDLMAMLTQRVGETLDKRDVHGNERHDLEKRRTVAFLLFNLGQLKGADNNPLYPPGRAEVVCGVREYTQAADSTALVLERLEKRVLDAVERDRGPALYPLDYRVHDPKRFAEKVTMLLEELETFPKKADDAKADPQAVKRRGAFQKAVQDLFADHLKEKRMKTDDKETVGQKVLGALTKLMKDQGVVITEDKDDLARKFKVKQTLFDRAVVRMTDGYEPGFVGRHHEQVNTVRELSGRIREMDNRLKELQAQAARLEAEYKERQAHVAGVEKKLVAARAATLQLANDLARLLDERFRAQVELSDADRRNQLMERRLRELERAPKKGKGGRP